jgi:hypothetical protein
VPEIEVKYLIDAVEAAPTVLKRAGVEFDDSSPRTTRPV